MVYSAVDTFDLSAPNHVEVTTHRRGVRTPVSGGTIKRRQTLSSESDQGVAAVRRFSLHYSLATKSDYDKAMALWKNTTGGTQGITFTNTYSPYSGSSETLIVRMVAQPFNLRRVNHVRFAFTIVLEEMLHGPGV